MYYLGMAVFGRAPDQNNVRLLFQVDLSVRLVDVYNLLGLLSPLFNLILLLLCPRLLHFMFIILVVILLLIIILILIIRRPIAVERASVLALNQTSKENKKDK